MIKDLDKLTPMMKQYLTIKNQYQDTILFYRLGDFYEMFFDDAKIASLELEIALTGRNGGLDEKIPMCGVPHHASQAYIEKLVEKGYKVAICEQVEDVNASKGIVKRDVVKIITPGTFQTKVSDDNLFVAHLSYNLFEYLLTFSDITTGEIICLKMPKNINVLYSKLKTYQIKEVILQDIDKQLKQLFTTQKIVYSLYTNASTNERNQKLVKDINQEYHLSIKTLFNYLESLQKAEINYFKATTIIDINQVLNLDYNCFENLDLVTINKTSERKGSLLWFLDHTKTAMGSRKMRTFIDQPLRNKQAILTRQSYITIFKDNQLKSHQLTKLLVDVYDLERIATKIGNDSVTPKDLLWLKRSIQNIPYIKELLASYQSSQIDELNNQINPLTELYLLIDQSIDDDLENTIKKGYNKELDDYHEVIANSKQWLIDFENQERQTTGIKNLKVGYNKVFGYFIEVSNANKHLIKDEFGYIRKQTLSNCERYISAHLKDQEALILNANENMSKLESSLYRAIKDQVTTYIRLIQGLADQIALIDVYLALGVIAGYSGYCLPEFNESNTINIKGMRHPVIEYLRPDQPFVSNDIIMDQDNFIQIITGPNMGGKTTYMKTFGVCAILAQMGSYIPCEYASLPIFDQIFTRIGAGDDLINGQSTFMVEMMEANFALTNASKDSLILLDELGRGTSTYDGMALAQSIIEYIALTLKAKTLFSTHYHELCQLGDDKVIKNVNAQVIENKTGIEFVYKIIDGGADRSYGIHVAKLAHLPESIIKRADYILNHLETKQGEFNDRKDYQEVELVENKIEAMIKTLDLNNMSPMQALQQLMVLQEEINHG